MTELRKTQKRLTLQHLFEENKPIWVINRSGTPNTKFERAGNVVLMLGEAGNHDKLTVPPGNDPMCLSDLTDYESLRRCSDLFKNTRVGILELMDPEEAEQYYQQNQERYQSMQQKIQALMTEAREDKQLPDEIETSAAPLNSVVLDICLKLRHKRIEESEALERLLENANVFSIDDFSYLQTNGKVKSVRKWAAQKLEEMMPSDEE